MTESNKRAIQFGAIFICCAVIIYFFMSARKPPSDINVRADQETTDNLKTRLREEVKELEVLLEKDPQNVGLITRIGNHYYDLDEHDKAITYYEQSLLLKPDDVFVLTDCAVMYYNSGQSEKAIEYLDKAIAIEPDFAQAYFNKGLILMSSMEDADGAVAAWREYIRIAPETEQAFFLEKQIEAIESGQE